MSSEQTLLQELAIYTDGACSPNPGLGGWGAVVLQNGEVVSELSGSEEMSTNNRMELTAAVKSLRSLASPSRIDLYTDSTYVKNGITDWIDKWQQNNWRTAAKTPVKNSDLWRELLDQIQRHDITWHWVKGHGTDRWNNRADELAVAARKQHQGQAGEPVSAEKTPGDAGDHIHLHTGVTCKHSAGVGSWAVVLNWREHVKILGERVTGMTANQLYLIAVISGLQSLKKELPVIVHTHSGYLYDGATTWLDGWRRRNWTTRDGNEVSNRSLWQELDALIKKYRVRFRLEDKENPPCFLQEAKELAREFEQGA